MDLSVLFQDSRVATKKTHIVMKSVGIESKQFKGWQHPPTKNADGSPAHALYPKKNKAAMEELGWVEVKQVKDPVDAEFVPNPGDTKPTRKARPNVEG